MAEGVGCMVWSRGGVIEEVCWWDGGYDLVVPRGEYICVYFEAEFEGKGEDGEECGICFAKGFAWRAGVVYLEVGGDEGGVR